MQKLCVSLAEMIWVLPTGAPGTVGRCFAAHRKLRGAITQTPRQQGIEEEANPGSARWGWAAGALIGANPRGTTARLPIDNRIYRL